MGVLGICFIIASSVALLPTLEAIENCYKVEGYIVPVLTTVDEYGALVTDIIGAYAQYLSDVGANGVLVSSTTGERPTLNVSDNKRLLDAWIEATEALDLFVVLSVGGVPLPDTLEMAAYAEKKGVIALFALPDVFFKPKTAEELAYNMQLIYQAAPNTPLVYDDIPEYTGVVVDIERFYELATQTIPTFRGVKSTSFKNLLLLRPKTRGQQKLYASNAYYLASQVCLGFKNYILREFNLFPKLIIDIVRYRENGNMSRSTNLYQRLLDLIEIITANGNELAILKEAMPLVTGIDVGPIRPPEIRPTFNEIVNLEEGLIGANIEIIDPTLNDGNIIPLIDVCSSDEK